jgi:hypothetical protein
MNANGIGRIGAEACFCDIIAATQALTIVSGVDARQGSLNPGALKAAAFALGVGHGLVLQCIHAAQPSDAGLVEFNRRAVAVVLFFDGAQFCNPCLQA